MILIVDVIVLLLAGTTLVVGSQDVLHDGIHANAVLDLGKDRGAGSTHLGRVSSHYIQVGAHNLGQVSLFFKKKKAKMRLRLSYSVCRSKPLLELSYLVDDQQIRLAGAWASLSWDLVSTSDIND